MLLYQIVALLDLIIPPNLGHGIYSKYVIMYAIINKYTHIIANSNEMLRDLCCIGFYFSLLTAF